MSEHWKLVGRAAVGVPVRDSVRTKASDDPQAAEQAEAKTKAQTEAHTEVQTEEWTGRPQLYLQMNTSKVMTWEEAQAEPTHTYTPLYRETQSKDRTGTTIWSVLTSKQTEQMEQMEAQTATRVSTEANVLARTEALTESEAQTQAEAQMQAQIQAKRVVQRPRRKKATVKCSVERQEGNRDGGRQEAQVHWGLYRRKGPAQSYSWPTQPRRPAPVR